MRYVLLIATFASSVVAGCSGELNLTGNNSSASPDGATSNSMAFRPGIQDDLDSAGCTAAACHGGTVAPMPLVAYPTNDNDWQANYNQVQARIGTVATSLLIEKAAGAGSHVESLTLADPMMDRWREWIENGAPYQAQSGGVDAGTGPPVDAAVQTADASDALTWEANVRPLLNARGCLGCHGSSGAYSLESYSAALGFGSDGIPNVVPGDALSLLIVYCEQGHYDMPAEDTLTVISWIVDWDARER